MSLVTSIKVTLNDYIKEKNYYNFLPMSKAICLEARGNGHLIVSTFASIHHLVPLWISAFVLQAQLIFFVLLIRLEATFFQAVGYLL